MPFVPFAVRLRVAALCLMGLAVPGALLTGVPWPLGPILALAFVLVGLYVLWCFWPRWQSFIPERLKARLPAPPPSQPFFLSFDDGPSPELTEALLDLLARYQIKASFFVLVQKAERFPQLLKRMREEGHSVGLHGWDHRKPFFKSVSRLEENLGEAKRRLEEILGGEKITLFRPSHGWKNPALVRAVENLGLQFSFWDYGLWDTDAPPAEELCRRLAKLPLARKPIVLLHDGRGDEPGPPAHGPSLLPALEKFFSALPSWKP